MHETDAAILTEANRVMEICNACRYCEGYCAVFPAMTLHRSFAEADLNHLANLCHNCKACYYACQYAPPHPFGVNVPQAFALLRDETYRRYAWPAPLARLFERNGTVVSLVTALAVTAVLLLTAGLTAPGTLVHAAVGARAFYRVIPWAVMAGVATLALGYAVLAMTIGAVRYWRQSGSAQVTTAAILRGVHDAFTLRNLGGGGQGCNDKDESFSTTRRLLHHAMAYGFLACFAATCTAAFAADILGWPAPYPWFSLPVILGTLGGLGLLVGTSGLFGLKLVTDPTPLARRLLGGDIALLVLLWLTAASGMLVLGWRQTSEMPLLLAIHLGLILALFSLLPYSKFVHGLYRTLALIRAAADRG
ncbi:tricarballylate utilization 4Fe-4S protein TcuB [Acidiphilium acidophilum]|uniref:tricarballylate utilization 4Fe-4S protein TcuB n=1 Tax=Acidiphilium acidophilum TaxID=76588 RepID=UPI002E8E79AA|nr:tricarballylate utilization 4Fe-4S protein TcuB [Acidiphilium acidophilum]